jgi:hypothetical protein
MTTTTESHVLVDACVAKAVGVKHDTMPARDIRKVLEEFREGPTGLLMTPLLRNEWERHASPIMKRWLARMVSRRRVRAVRDRRVNDFRTAARNSAADPTELEALEKDAHITEAAILLKAGVLSLDDRQLRLLTRVTQIYPLVGQVQWFHPVRNCEVCAHWVAAGCTDDQILRISSQAEAV